MVATVIDTDKRFELELAISDWHCASEMKTSAVESIARVLDIPIDDAVSLADEHRTAQGLLDSLGTEVVSYRLTASFDGEVDAPMAALAIGQLSDRPTMVSTNDLVEQINRYERSSTMCDGGESMLGWLFAASIAAGVVLIAASAAMAVLGIDCF